MQLKDIKISDLVGCRVVRETAVGPATRQPMHPEIFMGIEIEGEGFQYRDESLSKVCDAGWRVDNDDSLREGGMELVLREPLAGGRLAYAISALFQQHREGGIVWHPSPRAGTHFHVNVSDKAMGFVQAFTALAYCIDELIFAFAGEDRRWCSYCNSLNTVPPFALRSLFADTALVPRADGWHNVWPLARSDRYYGFNVASVEKFGTLELRYFPSPTSEEQVWSWMDLCQGMYEVAGRFENEESPAQAVIAHAMESPESLLRELPMLPSAPEAIVEAAEELHIIISLEPDSGEEESPTIRNDLASSAVRGVFVESPVWPIRDSTDRLPDPMSAASWLTTFDDDPSQQENS